MSEEIKQEEIKEGSPKEDNTNMPLVLYFTGAIGIVAVIFLIIFLFRGIFEDGLVLIAGIVLGVLIGVPIIGMGKIVDLLSEINKKMK